MEGQIWMVHPETAGVSQVPEDTFEEAWEPLGWQRAQLDEDGNPIVPEVKATSGTGTGDKKGPKATTPEGSSA
jgi:hypothetical protein